ncbi:MAG: pentapeptide repeat-containing protein [Alphaproteobacteria bacterium]|nr:MAG: pentapeptide repeat-containing protein [Alphaproteobacteria bacterium]
MQVRGIGRALFPFPCRRAVVRGACIAVLAITGLGAGPGSVAPVRAGCTDPPAPGVNWQRCVLDGSVFQGVDLAGARLRDASFFRSDLSGSDLSGISAFRVKFVNTDLRGARLDKAKLSEADFTKADLSEASLVGADLRRARFFHATLRGADLTGARLRGADFTGADLSGATWIDGKRICAEGSIGRCG